MKEEKKKPERVVSYLRYAGFFLAAVTALVLCLSGQVTLEKAGRVLFATGCYYLVAASVAVLLRLSVERSGKKAGEWFRKLLHMIQFTSVLPLLLSAADWQTAVFTELLLLVLIAVLLRMLERFKPGLFGHLINERGAGEGMGSLYETFLTIAVLTGILWGIFGDGRKYLVFLSVFVWGFSDMAAALVGKRFGHRPVPYLKNSKKTLEGLLANLGVSFPVALVILLYGKELTVVSAVFCAVILALVSGFVESISRGGRDTFTVPAALAVTSALLVLGMTAGYSYVGLAGGLSDNFSAGSSDALSDNLSTSSSSDALSDNLLASVSDDLSDGFSDSVRELRFGNQFDFILVICLFAGFGAGLGTGLCGLSAAAVIVPMLFSFLDIPAYQATAIALAADVLASASSALIYARHKNINLKYGTIMLLSIAVMTVAGSLLAHRVGNFALGSISIFVTFCLGVKFILKPVKSHKFAPEGKEEKKKIVQSLICGLGIGGLCGFIGTGGGTLMLIVLTAVIGFDLKMAVGTSVYIMTVTAFIGAATHFVAGGIPDLLVTALTIVFTLIWAQIGAVFANAVSPEKMNRCCGAVLMVLGVAMMVMKFWL